MSLDPGNPAGGTNGTAAPTPSWHESIPADMTVQVNDSTQPNGTKTIPLREHDAIKNVKDLGTFAKSYLDAQSELGRRVRVPTKDMKPEDIAKWRSEFLPKLKDAGIFVNTEGVPESPDGYKIDMPEGAKEGVTWSNEIATNFKALAKNLGLTQAQVDQLMAFDNARISAGNKMLKTSAEAAEAALKQKWGADYQANFEIASRAVGEVFKDDPEAIKFFDDLGIGNHPLFLNRMFEIGARSQEGDGHIPGGGSTGAQTQADAAKEMVDIIRNPQNPKYKLFHAGDQETKRYVEALRDKAWPGTTEVL